MIKEETVNLLRANVMVACDTSDKVGYGTPLNKAIEEALNMAIKALEQQPSDDCVSRTAVLETIEDCNSDGLKGIFCSYDDGERFKEYIKRLPPVTPTQCIAAVRFNKEDLREN